jgi:hypothetical protein
MAASKPPQTNSASFFLTVLSPSPPRISHRLSALFYGSKRSLLDLASCTLEARLIARLASKAASRFMHDKMHDWQLKFNFSFKFKNHGRLVVGTDGTLATYYNNQKIECCLD